MEESLNNSWAAQCVYAELSLDETIMYIQREKRKVAIFFVCNMEIHPCKFKHKNHEPIQTYQGFCQRGQSVRM